jgi:methylated-DNA-[protein]-cysteine S-methyltransferase
VDSPVGTLLLAATDQGLVRIAYQLENHDQVLQTLSERVSPRIPVCAAPA